MVEVFDFMRDNPRKTVAGAALILLVLLAGMAAVTQGQNTDTPVNNISNSSDNISDTSDNSSNESDISVKISSEVCVEKVNTTGYNCTNSSH